MLPFDGLLPEAQEPNRYEQQNSQDTTSKQFWSRPPEKNKTRENKFQDKQRTAESQDDRNTRQNKAIITQDKPITRQDTQFKHKTRQIKTKQWTTNLLSWRNSSWLPCAFNSAQSSFRIRWLLGSKERRRRKILSASAWFIRLCRRKIISAS